MKLRLGFLVVWGLTPCVGSLPAQVKDGSSVFAELRKQMNCEYFAAKDGCIEFARGEFLRGADRQSERRFVLGRTITETESRAGTETVRVDFVSGPQRGARYAKELDFPQATSRENAVVPEVDPQKIIRVAMSPLAQVLGTRLPFIFLNLYGYLSGYRWDLNGATGGAQLMLIGRPRASGLLLPSVELRLDQKGPVHTVGQMWLFTEKGVHRADMYKFTFEKYKKLGAKDIYRPMEVDITLHLGRRTEAERLRFDEWLFRVDPSQPEKRALFQLNSALSIPHDSKLLTIR